MPRDALSKPCTTSFDDTEHVDHQGRSGEVVTLRNSGRLPCRCDIMPFYQDSLAASRNRTASGMVSLRDSSSQDLLFVCSVNKKDLSRLGFDWRIRSSQYHGAVKQGRYPSASGAAAAPQTRTPPPADKLASRPPWPHPLTLPRRHPATAPAGRATPALTRRKAPEPRRHIVSRDSTSHGSALIRAGARVAECDAHAPRPAAAAAGDWQLGLWGVARTLATGQKRPASCRSEI
jgi:hypothetical protein